MPAQGVGHCVVGGQVYLIIDGEGHALPLFAEGVVVFHLRSLSSAGKPHLRLLQSSASYVPLQGIGQ